MIGEKVRIARKQKGYSQVELAGIVGIAQASLSSIESGKTDPLRKTLIALAKALGDNFGDPSLNESVEAGASPPPSKREIARSMTATELVSLKFGGGESSSNETRMLAKLLDEALAKEGRVTSYPLAKGAKTFKDKKK